MDKTDRVERRRRVAGSRPHGMAADHLVQGREVTRLLLPDAEPPLEPRASDHKWEENHCQQRGPDRHALGREHHLRLMAKPRPLQHAGVPGKTHLCCAVLLCPLAEHLHRLAFDGHRPVLHLAIHERPCWELHQGHQLVEVQCGSQIERNHIAKACARIAILNGHAASLVRRCVGGVARCLPHADRQVRDLERHVDGADLLPGLPRQNLRGAHRGNPVGRHIDRQGLLHCPRHDHRLVGRLLDEVGQVLAVVSVEADALEPTEEDRGLILPLLRKLRSGDDHVGQHDIAHIVPNAGVHELHTPLVA
mmetsp:Transcript_71395/g.206732  ORF Transcript_71395/g.206732 Transcript_71395/m.206732 type:complete len:306 (-) Transcript_71395:1028-1945(-)